jgi:hypothetical protein
MSILQFKRQADMECRSKEKCRIIPFPTFYDYSYSVKNREKTKEIKPIIINAPYGEPVPEGFQDYREALQRDGLALVCYKKLKILEERFFIPKGIYFEALWVKSNGPRYKAWSGLFLPEYVYNVMPYDYESYYKQEGKNVLEYIVNVAPENCQRCPLPEFTAYIESLKKAEIKNATGNKVNFDYVFNYGTEKRSRYVKKNIELIDLKFPAVVIKRLNEQKIYTLAGLQELSLEELSKMQSVGVKVIDKVKDCLGAAGITLKERE